MIPAKFQIPCLHDSQHDIRHVVPDYHPLTAGEIAELYNLAKLAGIAGDARSHAKAVTRLVQGIPGMTCPVPADGEVAEVMTWVERFMVNAGPLTVLIRVLT